MMAFFTPLKCGSPVMIFVSSLFAAAKMNASAIPKSLLVCRILKWSRPACLESCSSSFIILELLIIMSYAVSTSWPSLAVLLIISATVIAHVYISVAEFSKRSFSFAPCWVPLKYSIQAHASIMYLFKLSFHLVFFGELWHALEHAETIFPAFLNRYLYALIFLDVLGFYEFFR